MDDAGVARLYESGSENNVTIGEEANVKRTMAGYYRLASRFLQGRERILDVGCDIGLLLEVAQEDGFRELYGIEPVPAARQSAAKLSGAQITDEFFETAGYPENFFDLMCFVHVVDHLFQPKRALAKALGHLKPGGVILAVVHNVDSLLFHLLRERFPIFNLYHHYFFNKTTLAKLFASEGYEILGVYRTRNCYSLGFFASRLPGVPEFLRLAVLAGLATVGLSRVPINIPVGNIGIVARRPVGS
jgi:SAM-dependent methyltransferase